MVGERARKETERGKGAGRELPTPSHRRSPPPLATAAVQMRKMGRKRGNELGFSGVCGRI
jgi:hypothetical protein